MYDWDSGRLRLALILTIRKMLYLSLELRIFPRELRSNRDSLRTIFYLVPKYIFNGELRLHIPRKKHRRNDEWN